jgi:Domain of unknown function (DUF4105)
VSNALPKWLVKVVRKTCSGIWFLCQILLIAWATLAIYYSNLPWKLFRFALALVFIAFGIWTLWLSRNRRMRWIFALLFLGVLAWWISIRPSADRVWRPEVAVMPRAIINGDRVRLVGCRNFDYRSTDDFTVRYEDREVSLTNLVSVDFFISYWSPGPVGHTFVSFCFDNAPPVCISIEARKGLGQSFSIIPTMFKQYQLIYVVGDERDLVRVRTNFRPEDVYLYHIRIAPEYARRLFQVYLQRINKLADRPEFYHLLKNNCTVNIIRYANSVGRQGGWEYRHWLNGLVDRYLYEKGYVDTSLTFTELRRGSQINEAAQKADNAADFSERIRASLPTRHL